MIAGEGGQSQVKVVVVIVTWNHYGFLPKCLESLFAQTYPSVKVIIVDNASRDGSPEWVEKFVPQAQLIRMESNVGFSRAFNSAVKVTQSDFVLSLNPDVYVRSHFITNLIEVAQNDTKIGIVAPKLLRADDIKYLDSTGLFINRQRRPFDRGQMQLDQNQFNDKTEIFGACGAAALYRRSMLEDLTVNQEYFDEDFFAYYEDIDLAWRAKLRGWRCVFAPDAVAEHVRGWGDTLRKSPSPKGAGPRLALRNRLLMILKNDSGNNFLRDAPMIIISEIIRSLYMLIFRPGALLGFVDFIKLTPKVSKKRKIIQAGRTAEDNSLRHWFILYD